MPATDHIAHAHASCADAVLCAVLCCTASSCRSAEVLRLLAPPPVAPAPPAAKQISCFEHDGLQYEELQWDNPVKSS